MMRFVGSAVVVVVVGLATGCSSSSGAGSVSTAATMSTSAAGGAGGAGGHVGSGGVGGAGGAVEVCNFRDDDGDGHVDEGFDWVASPFVEVLSGNCFMSVRRALTLHDGRVAIAGIDSYGAGHDRGYVAVLSPAGEVVLGPVWTPIDNLGGDWVGLAEGKNGEIGALYGTTAYAPTCGADGCPVHFVRLDGASPEPLVSTHVAYAFAPRSAMDLAYTPFGWATIARDQSDATHVTWIDDAGKPTRDVALPGTTTTNGEWGANLAAGIGLGWARAPASTAEPGVELGVLALDGASVLAPPTLVTGAIDAGFAFRFHAFAWQDDGYFFAYRTAKAPDPSVSWLARWGADGALAAGPVRVGRDGDMPITLAPLGPSMLALTGSAETALSVTLSRFSHDLVPTPTPSGPLTLQSPSLEATVAVVAGGLLVFRGEQFKSKQCGTGDHTVEVARIACP